MTGRGMGYWRYASHSFALHLIAEHWYMIERRPHRARSLSGDAGVAQPQHAVTGVCPFSS